MRTLRRVALVGLLAAACAATASAQAWRGMGRLAGRVTDQDGKPVEGVVVKAYLPSADGATEAKTNRRGEWAIGGLARGSWQLDFVKEGFTPRQIGVMLGEAERLPPIDIVLEKARPVVDPSVEIREALAEAGELMDRKQFAEARAVYAGLLARFPRAHQMHTLIARSYYGEGALDKAIEQLRQGLEKDPGNTEITLFLGNLLIERGDADEGQRLLASVEAAAVTDPTTFVNVGIALMNQDKPAEASAYFDKAIARFPEHADAYYYRGLTRLQRGETAAAKADLEKFVALAPNAPEAPMARKMLEQLK